MRRSRDWSKCLTTPSCSSEFRETNSAFCKTPKSLSKPDRIDIRAKMKKPDICTLILERRQCLSPAELHTIGQKIADVFFQSIDLAGVRVLHVFLPIDRFREVDSQIIIHRIWAEYPTIR